MRILIETKEKGTKGDVEVLVEVKTKGKTAHATFIYDSPMTRDRLKVIFGHVLKKIY